MRVRNPIYVLCLVLAVALALPLVGCSGDDAEPDSSTEAASEATAESEEPVDASETDDESLEFDDAPEIAGYEITEQVERGNELYVTLRSDVSEDQATQDFTDWAESNGWTVLDVEIPNVDLVFEKPDRVYPLKISVFPRPSTGDVEVLAIMPAHGDKLGDW